MINLAMQQLVICWLLIAQCTSLCVEYECSFEIISVDHSVGAVGQYFNFDVATSDCVLGETWPTDKTFEVIYSGDNTTREVVMWRTSNGGTNADGHGRKTDNPSGGDWEVGKQIVFLVPAAACECCTESEAPRLGLCVPCSIEIISVDHGSGTNGKYFNFDVDTSDCMLGEPWSSDDTFEVLYSGDNSHREVVMWRSANGGSCADGHGRQTSNAASGDWQVGEHIAFWNPRAVCGCAPDTDAQAEAPTLEPTQATAQWRYCYCEDEDEDVSTVARLSTNDKKSRYGGYDSVAYETQVVIHIWGTVISLLLLMILVVVCKNRRAWTYNSASEKQ